jgi:hypothetical protein
MAGAPLNQDSIKQTHSLSVSFAEDMGKLYSGIAMLWSECMDSLLKILSCLMLSALITIQLLLVTPYRNRLTDDTINGRVLRIYESVIRRGTVVLDAMGNYEPNTACIIINGDKQKMVDKFPVEINLCDGDIVEIQSKKGNEPFYVFLLSRKGSIKTDLKESTTLINPGINRIFRVLENNILK